MKRGRLKGHSVSEETRKKLRLFNLGKKQTPEHIEKRVIQLRGKNNPMFGTKHTEEWKLNMSKIKRESNLTPRGEKNNMWKGGITPINEKIRKSYEMKLWKKSCLERDNWTCQKTGIRGEKLHPHHIQNFAQFPEFRFAIDNGITLSEVAHRKFHKKYGIRNNTKEQLEEFLNEK